MKQQDNHYTDDTLHITSNGIEVATCLLPHEHMRELRLYLWKYRGKSGIFNEFNVSLSALLADIYGFDGNNWRRVDTSSTSYLADNFSTKLQVHGKDVRNVILFTVNTPHVAKKQTFFPNIKWKTKSDVEELVLDVYRRSHKVGKVTIKCNVYLRQFIPREVRFNATTITLLDGTRLDRHVADVSGISDPDEAAPPLSYIERSNYFDFTVDNSCVNGVGFCNTVNSFRRIHRCSVRNSDDTVDKVTVIEIRECPKDVADHPLPKTCLKPNFIYDGGWRVSFVAFDSYLEPKIRNLDDQMRIYFDVNKSEFYIGERTSDGITRLQLKRALMHASGKRVANVYVAPKLNLRYEHALAEATSNEKFTAADRVRAAFENATGEKPKFRMYSEPKNLKYKKIWADRDVFIHELHGVGFWCKDLRISAMRIKE